MHFSLPPLSAPKWPTLRRALPGGRGCHFVQPDPVPSAELRSTRNDVCSFRSCDGASALPRTISMRPFEMRGGGAGSGCQARQWGEANFLSRKAFGRTRVRARSINRAQGFLQGCYRTCSIPVYRDVSDSSE